MGLVFGFGTIQRFVRHPVPLKRPRTPANKTGPTF
jgi:hypothetical protein